MNDLTRRDLMRLAGLGGVVFASNLGCRSLGIAEGEDDFYFAQLSDTHWGFNGPKVNPDAGGTLKKAVAAVNGLQKKPDFVVFTGDLTHTTEDAKERRARMDGFRDIANELRVKTIYFMPGEHDAALDRGDVYQEKFGPMNYTFDHKGVHFVALDNVSDPGAAVGDAQLKWLKADLARFGRKTPIVVLTHRPLFDLYPQWDWATKDGVAVIDVLMPYESVTVFYGHIHQENHHRTGHIQHHSAKSLIFPLPAPGSVPKKAPVPWTEAEPYKGLGFREVDADVPKRRYEIVELPVPSAVVALAGLDG